MGVGETEGGDGGRSERDVKASSLIALTMGCVMVSLYESEWRSESTN